MVVNAKIWARKGAADLRDGLLRRLGAILLALALLSGCAGGQTASGEGQAASGGAQSTLSGAQTPSGGGYVIPAFLSETFHEDEAVDGAMIQADLSQLASGVVAVRAEDAARLKFQVICGNETYNYDLPGDGTAVFYPLSLGSGSYTFRLMEQVEGTKYACAWSETSEVVLEDEFQPFLHASQIVPYTEDAACVQKARELASGCGSDSDVAAAVYDFLVDAIAYDTEKAASVGPGYLPDPDETLASGKGICFDYASLAAAMLRSVGIPCKVITGYVDADTYHAWNSFYLENQGWITADIKVSAHHWQRVDITFAAGGMPPETGGALEYTTRYVY